MKDVTFVFGKNSSGKFCQYPLGNVLVTGVTGSGKFVFLQNILDSLILRYEDEDVSIMVYDEKGVEFAGCNDHSGIKYVSMCRWASGGMDTSYVTALRKLIYLLNERKYFDIWMRRPTVILLDGLDTCEVRTNGAYSECLKYLLDEGPSVEMYFILCSEPVKSVLYRYVDHVQYRACLRVNDKEVSKLMTGIEAATDMEKYGSVYIAGSCPDPVKLSVPFYSRSAKKDICNGHILPNGVKFEDSRLRKYAISNRLMEG